MTNKTPSVNFSNRVQVEGYKTSFSRPTRSYNRRERAAFQKAIAEEANVVDKQQLPHLPIQLVYKGRSNIVTKEQEVLKTLHKPVDISDKFRVANGQFLAPRQKLNHQQPTKRVKVPALKTSRVVHKALDTREAPNQGKSVIYDLVGFEPEQEVSSTEDDFFDPAFELATVVPKVSPVKEDTVEPTNCYVVDCQHQLMSRLWETFDYSPIRFPSILVNGYLGVGIQMGNKLDRKCVRALVFHASVRLDYLELIEGLRELGAIPMPRDLLGLQAWKRRSREANYVWRFRVGRPYAFPDSPFPSVDLCDEESESEEENDFVAQGDDFILPGDGQPTNRTTIFQDFVDSGAKVVRNLVVDTFNDAIDKIDYIGAAGNAIALIQDLLTLEPCLFSLARILMDLYNLARCVGLPSATQYFKAQGFDRMIGATDPMKLFSHIPMFERKRDRRPSQWARSTG